MIVYVYRLAFYIEIAGLNLSKERKATRQKKERQPAPRRRY
ncbi:hypothetical protein [Sporosarcina phage Lietuvens]|nr:hypothetical protein [Sporosarcina phage Lietuvens]